MNEIKGNRNLINLLAEAGIYFSGGGDVAITGVVDDSRQVRDGSLFVALKGTALDARRFIPQALEAGASAVVVDDPEGVDAGDATLVVVPDARRALATLAHAWFGRAADGMRLVGVTGTNGKTTVTHFVESIFQKADLSPAVMGTIEYRHGSTREAAGTTTPSPLQVARFLAGAKEAGARAAAIEASSHGIEQRRLDGMKFDAAVITNLTQDHLDYHHDMATYGKAKETFFFARAEGEEPGHAVFNLDDAFAASLAARYERPKKTFAVEADADVTARDVDDNPAGAAFSLSINGEKIARPHIAMPGLHNVSNALAAIAACEALGMKRETILAGVEALRGVPGRFERIEAGQPFHLVIDYAHTPDALRVLLEEARRLSGDKRLLVVFGCGGQRDPGKRPIMGAIAARLCDHVIVTNCNPRGEDPDAIVRAIVKGVESEGAVKDRDFEIELDRRAAMTLAMEMAEEGDMVVIAGRGHEPRQIIGEERRVFDDRVVAREILSQMGYEPNG